MRCPFCATLENKVIDSRLSQAGEVTRRRRECEGCGRRYTTYERVEQALPLVMKKDGRRQPFDADKLRAGLQRAAAKRDVSAEALERIVSEVQRALVELGQSEVDASLVGHKALEQLRDVDQVAYVRFASVYREFQDVREFISVLRGLLDEGEFEAEESRDAAAPVGDA